MTTATLKVPSAVAGFMVGQLLSSVAEQASYWRALSVEAEQGDMGHLDDETLVSLAGTIEPVMADGEYTDADEYVVSVLAAIEEGGEEDEPLAVDISAVADKVAGNTNIAAWISKIIQGQKDVDSGPMVMSAELLEVLTPEELAIIPWPGSEAPIGNRAQDVTKWQKPKADGGTKEVSSSVIKAFIHRQPRIVALANAVKERESDLVGKLDDSPDIKYDLRNLNKQITNASRAYTFAIKLALLYAKLTDHAHIEMEFDRTPDDTAYSNETYCVTISNKHRKKAMATLTVANVTKAKFALIDANTTYDQFTAMLKRTKGASTTVTKYPLPTTVAEFGEVLSVTAHAFAHAGLYSQLNVAMAFTAGEQKEQADDLAYSVRELEKYCNDILDKDNGKLRARASGVAAARHKQAA